MARSYSAILIPLSKIYSDEGFNCRGRIEPYEVVDLANDIKKTGLQTPISVQPWTEKPGYDYRVLAGHRRLMAYVVNGEEAIPCFIIHVADELEARDYNLKENLFRQDLNFLQESKALEPYFKKNLTDRAIAERLNRSAGWVTPRRQLLQLPSDLQDEAAKGTINQGHVKSLFLLRNKSEKMYELFRSIKEAKDRGEKVVNIKKEKDAVEITKIKKPATHEIHALLDIVFSMLTGRTGQENFGARCMAFAAGAISEVDWWFALKRECERNGVPFDPPTEIKELLGE